MEKNRAQLGSNLSGQQKGGGFCFCKVRFSSKREDMANTPTSG
jgi:hypothetical protein